MADLVISYSRADQPLVRAVVLLLETGLSEIGRTVFWDGELEPGERWFEQLKQAIDVAPQLFVFWCEHSAASRQVRREYLYALRKKKRVVPVLLDNATLARRIAPIHGIDLRGVFRHLGMVTLADERPKDSSARPALTCPDPRIQAFLASLPYDRAY